jgi:4-amino-4-deoxychorismate lyase
MSQLLETIMIRQKSMVNLEFHNARVNYTRRALFNATDTWDLDKLIALPETDTATVYRCRFLYAVRVEGIEIIPYIPRKIVRLYLTVSDDLAYAFKFSDRSSLDELKRTYAPDPDSDVLIIKKGKITDTSFSNIAFYDGYRWVTPASPLLKGTKRALYIRNGILTEMEIFPADLHTFQKARLINAMLDLEGGQDIPIANIR